MRTSGVLGVVAVSLALASGARAEFVAPELVTAADAGGGSHVRGWDALGGSLPISFQAFSGNNGGVRVATADVTGDGRPEIVAAPGASGSEIRVFDARTFALVHRFVPYWSWGSGVFVGGGDVDGDGRAEIVAGTGPGCCTSARFISVSPSRELAGFFLYGSNAQVGARVVLADFTGDGRAELAALPVQTGGNGRVSLYGLASEGTPFRTLQAFQGNATTSLAAGDVTGDARAEVVVSAVGAPGAQIRVLDASSGATIVSIVPFAVTPATEIAVAVGDVDRDGRGDIVAAAQTWEGLSVRAFDSTGRLLASFFALDDKLVGPVSLAAADLTGDGRAEIVLGSGPTMGEPRIAVFDGVGRELGGFAYDEPFFLGGARVALGDVRGSVRPEVVTAAGPGRPAEIRIYDPEYDFDGNLLDSFLPYGAAFTGGLFVAAADTNGDLRPEIVVGPGAGIEPRVKVLAGNGHELSSFLAFEPDDRGGVRVAAGDLDADGKAELVVARASGSPQVRVFSPAGDARLAIVPFTGDAGAEVAVVDRNGDGRGEIAVSDPGGGLAGIRIFDGTTGALIDELRQPGPGARLAAIDVDGDGKQELAAVPLERPAASVLLLRGHTVVQSFAPYPWSSVHVFVAAAAPVGTALALDPKLLRGIAGTRVRGQVAELRDAAVRGSAKDFRATVDWGEASGPEPAVVTALGAGRFAISGAHTYFEPFADRVVVTVDDARGKSVTATTPVVVQAGPLRLTPVAGARAHVNRRSLLLLGVLRGGVPPRVRVSIAWGDGSSSQGTLRRKATIAEVVGAHRYRRVGDYRVVVRVTGSRVAVARVMVRVR